MEWFSMLKLDLEAVVEDAGDEVFQFEIQISLICWDFVGLYIRRNISSYYQDPSRGRIILRNPIILSLYLGISSEAFFAIFNSSYKL